MVTKRGIGRKHKVTGDPLPPSGIDPLVKAPDSQAKRIIQRFGGVKNLRAFMQRAGVLRTAMSIYQWVYHGGLIPPNGVRDVFLAELEAGITLTDHDWSPYQVVDGNPPVIPVEPIPEAPTPKKKRRVL